jgi:hypothetical protein
MQGIGMSWILLDDLQASPFSVSQATCALRCESFLENTGYRH